MDVNPRATVVFKVHCQSGRFVSRAMSVVLATSLLAAHAGVSSAQNPATPTPIGPVGEGAKTPLRGSPGLILSLSYSPDGELMESGGADGNVRLFDAATGKVIRTHLKHVGRAAGVAYSPDGKWIVSGSSDNTLTHLGCKDGDRDADAPGARRGGERGRDPRRWQTDRERRRRPVGHALPLQAANGNVDAVGVFRWPIPPIIEA